MLQVESEKWLKENGPLEVGDVAVTGAGRLEKGGVSSIFHTVSPNFKEDCTGDETLAEERLRITYASCLQKAKELQYPSVTFPGLGTGLSFVSSLNSASL